MMYFSEVTSKLFNIYLVKKILKFSIYNSQLFLAYLTSRILNKLLNTHDCLT